jgi:hypothetical protein
VFDRRPLSRDDPPPVYTGPIGRYFDSAGGGDRLADDRFRARRLRSKAQGNPDGNQSGISFA